MRNFAVSLSRKFLRTIARFRRWNFPFVLLDEAELMEGLIANRNALKRIESWMPTELISRSVFRYGINPDIERLIDLPLDNEVTHADLLTYFGRASVSPCRYLELGVSVGKTFWQVLHSCAPCECWGFDIEEISPALTANLERISREEWTSPTHSIKKTPSSITRYLDTETGSTVVYICADIFDKRGWSYLEGGRFNLVLSDALHTPEALAFEWDQITDLRVLDPFEAVVLWDDLDGSMHDWFLAARSQIAKELRTDEKFVDTAFVNGWLGTREFPHRLGIAISGRR